MKDAPRGRYRDALRQRDFRLLVGAFVVDQIGSWSYSVVIAVYIFDRTHSPQWLAAAAGSRWVPGLLVGSYGGVLADRYERTRVMISSAMASASVMGGMAVVVGLKGPVALVLVLSGLAAVAASPYRPAAGALTPEVVGEKDLAAANTIFSTLESLVVVIGPGIGGLLLLTGEPVTGVILNAASFVVAALVVLRLRVTSTGGAAAGENVFALWVTGLRALARQRVALALVLFCGLDSAIYGASTVIYVPLSERLGTGATGYSYLLAGSALGGVLAAGLANRLSASSRLAPVILGSICLQAVPYLVTAYVHAPALAFVLQVVSGVGMIIVDVLAITALQRDLPRDVLSRVLGVFDAVILAATVAASFIGAAVLTASGLVHTLIAIGIGFPAVALIGLPPLLRADRQSAATVERLRPRVEVLAALDLFAGVERNVLERLAAGAEERSMAARAVVIREGDVADALWILVSGSLSIRVTGGREHARQLPTVHAPGYVGELGLLHGVPRTATVRTREPSVLLRIDGADFLSALEATTPSTSLLTLAGTRMARTTPRPARTAQGAR